MTPRCFTNLNDICRFLGKLSQQTYSGELLLHSDRHNSRINFDSGKISSATTSGQKVTFQKILEEERNLDKLGLCAVINESHRLGHSDLDEILKDIGINDNLIRQGIRLRHIRSALQALTDWGNSFAMFDDENDASSPVPIEEAFTLNEVLPAATTEQLAAA